MKQSLQLRIGQHLSLTPQLQQAIRLLQFSTLELQAEIQQTLESNPLLESEEMQEAPAEAAPTEPAAEPNEPAQLESTSLTEEIPESLPVDSQWEEIYDTGIASSGSTNISSNQDAIPDDYLQHNSAPESLHSLLLEQLNLLPLSERDQIIGEALIDAVSTDGFLRQSVDDIAQLFDDQDNPVEADEIEAVLHHLQQFDPPGVCARDPRESLLIQLRQLPADTPMRDTAMVVVDKHLDALTRGDHRSICTSLGVDPEALDAAVALVRSLNPRPGAGLAGDDVQYVIPDVYVTLNEGRWNVSLNEENLPRLRINAAYAGLIRRGDSSADNQFLRRNLQEARWFLKSLQSRSETLLRVATSIVERQQGFLEHGDLAMKPMVLRDIAEALELHESTISRVTTRKYMHTPRGVFELKYFFSSHIAADSGDQHSSTAIRARIKALVAKEPPHKPLSDNRISTLLADQGVRVARRTVAKYREALFIPPSNERKRLA